MGKLDLDQTFPTARTFTRLLVRELDQATDPWGVKVDPGYGRLRTSMPFAWAFSSDWRCR